MLRLIITLIFFISVSPAMAQDKVFNAQYFTLENGLEIVVIPNHRAPVVTHMLWYKVGAADEPKGKSGIAHFLEHLMFKGSTGLKAGEFSEKIRSLGGHDNAFTSQDYTAYYQSIAVQHLKTVMRMEAGRMRGLNPPTEHFLSERDVILEERKQRIDNNPRTQFSSENIRPALFPNHPYGIPVIGWSDEISNLSWDDARTFYNQYYGPNNAILIVSGDVTGEQVYTLAKDIYGTFAKIDLPSRSWTQIGPFFEDVAISKDHKSIHEPVISYNYHAPSTRQNAKDALALQVLQEIMGNGSTSRLYKALVVEQKITTNIGLDYNPNALSNSSISAYALPKPGVSLSTVQNAFEEQLRLLIQKGVSADELKRAKTRMQSAAIYARDSLNGPAMIFGRALTTGSTLNDVEYWPRNISRVNAEDITRVATRYLNPDSPEDSPVIRGHLMPASATTSDTKETP